VIKSFLLVIKSFEELISAFEYVQNRGDAELLLNILLRFEIFRSYFSVLLVKYFEEINALQKQLQTPGLVLDVCVFTIFATKYLLIEVWKEWLQK